MGNKDIPVSAIIGFLVALLLLPILRQSGFRFPYPYALTLLLTFPVLSILTLWLASRAAQNFESAYQAAKFVLVGTLNTFVDWGLLNLLLMMLAVTHGPLYPVCKGISFVVAVTNSYFWNKFWTFKKPLMSNNAGKINKKDSTELWEFSMVSLIGFALNGSIANLIVNHWGPHFQMGVKLWATAGAFGGTIAGLVWNFTGYKLFVFRTKGTETPN